MQNLQTKLSDKTWTDTQEPEFINNLTQVNNIVENLSAQVFLFLNYFQQYAEAVHNSPIFAQYNFPEDQENGNLSPTQTSQDGAPAQGADNA
jgi:hypothetical protein